MTPTKYAEWVTQPCGRCRLHVDIGSIIADDIDPNCHDHQTIVCAVCGKQTRRTTIIHGSFGGHSHRVVEQGTACT